MSDQTQELRMLEAMLFAATEPLDEATLASHLPEGTALAALLGELQAAYAERGINVVRVAKRWAMRTAVDLAPLLQRDVEVGRRLSRAGVETLSIIAYHQPVTRAEIEEMRGVSASRGTLDILLEAGWIKPRGRRQTPGRPVTWVTTDGFLDHFGLESLDDLPGVSDLRAAGLLNSGPSARSYGLELSLGGGGEAAADSEDADAMEPLSDKSDN